jgi:hypothetical protein
MERRRSGLGIASFGISMVTGVTVFALVVFAGVMEASGTGGMDDMQTMIVGLGLIVVFTLNAFGIGLAFGALVQVNTIRTLGVLGLIFNMVLMLGLVAMVILGLTL